MVEFKNWRDVWDIRVTCLPSQRRLSEPSGPMMALKVVCNSLDVQTWMAGGLKGVMPGNTILCLSTMAFSQDCDLLILCFIISCSIQGCSEKLHHKTEELVWPQLVLVAVVHRGSGLVGETWDTMKEKL